MPDTKSVSNSGLLVDKDDKTKTATHFHFDEHEGKHVVEEVQDVTDTIEDNKSVFASVDERARWRTGSGQMNHVARIPLAMFYDIEFQKVVKDPVALKKYLNDHFNSKLRVRPGKI